MKKLVAFFFLSCLISCTGSAQKTNAVKEISDNKKVMEINKNLTPEQKHILFEKGTELPHTGKYNLHFEEGVYHCANCNAQLFESDTKFHSNCGWPSFDKAIKGAVEYKKDTSHGMIRTEILCANCGGHLGHVFEDGPTETGQRYCINSASLDFAEKKE